MKGILRDHLGQEDQGLNAFPVDRTCGGGEFISAFFRQLANISAEK